MTLSDHQYEFLKDLLQLLNFAIEHGFKVTFGEVYRTPQKQTRRYEAGESDTLNSNHQKKTAADLNFFPRYGDDLKEIGEYWKSLNPLNRWGGDFVLRKGGRDTNHFERNI